jgi:hypothetical protein
MILFNVRNKYYTDLYFYKTIYSVYYYDTTDGINCDILLKGGGRFFTWIN